MSMIGDLLKGFKKLLQPSVIESREDIIKILEKAEKNKVIGPKVKDLLERILKNATKSIGRIMTPRTEMVYVERGDTLQEAVQVYNKHGFTKLPVIDPEEDDRFIGIIYMQEVLKHIDELSRKKVEEVMRKDILYMPETQDVISAFANMQKRKVSIALVLDEYGNVVGLITMEDFLEEFVGDITEEYDREEVLYTIEPDRIVFQSRISLDEASEILIKEGYIKEPLKAKEVNSLGGFLLEKKFKVIPKPGETWEYKGLRFRILEADPQRIKKIAVERKGDK